MAAFASIAALTVLALSQPLPTSASDDAGSSHHRSIAHHEQHVNAASGAAVMRRQTAAQGAKHDADDHARHLTDMFKALDLNGDGRVSGSEVKKSRQASHLHFPELIQDVMSHIQDDDGFDLAQFQHAVKKVPAVRHAVKRARKMHAAEVTADGAAFIHDDSENVHRQAVHHQRHRHTKLDARTMFKSLDRNEDGVVSGAEVKQGMSSTDVHIPKVFFEIASHIKDTDSFNYYQFLAAVKTAKLHAKPKDASMFAQSFIEASQKMSESNVAPPAWVSCGGHKAPTCTACTTTDATGRAVFDHGEDWCNGDCAYLDGECRARGASAAATAKPPSTQTTTPIPDLVNPNITARDIEIINQAAESSIREENLEAASKQRQEEEAIKNKGWGWDNFWLVAIVTFSVILGICACVSIIGVVILCCMGTPGDLPAKDIDDPNVGLSCEAAEGEAAGEEES